MKRVGTKCGPEDQRGGQSGQSRVSEGSEEGGEV